MATVNTVLGEVSSDDLGVTYMHEHIFIINPEMQFYWPGYQGWNEDEAVEKGRVALRRLHEEYGVDTVLDPTVAGLGRNIGAVARALEGTGLNVVAATGWYTYNELPFTFFAKDLDARTAELERLFVQDFEEGLDGTSIKPGVIKCSIDKPGLTPDIEALLRASARAHRRTGLPITTHSEYTNESGLIQQQIFMEEGVDMEAVVIGHCNQSNDLGYMEKLIEQGSYIGFDRCGIESPVASFEVQIDCLTRLCRRGHADRVVLSHDNMVWMDLMPAELVGRMRPHFPYGFIYAQTLPALREAGVSEDDINTMLVENPRRYFGRTAEAS
jgi:phosphotriesterase-related protein